MVFASFGTSKNKTFYFMLFLFVVDLTLIAVGIGKYDIEELRLIATDKTEHVFEASDFSGLINLVSSLKNRTCTSTYLSRTPNSGCMW